MQLTARHLEEFERNGFLVFPELFTPEEVQVLRGETDRLATIEADYIKRERNGALRTIFRVHEDNGPTQSPEYRALSRSPRLLGPARQLLHDPELYIFHTKINLKPAIEGTIWAWHQDYGSWRLDGVPTSNMLTVLVMLDDADEISGALYMLPGTHKLGTIPHVEDAGVGALNQYSVPREPLLRALNGTKAVPMTGKAGTVAFFHCNVIHGSGHNMSGRDRRQLYVVYNPVANKQLPVANPRGDHVASRNQAPLPMADDAGSLAAAAARGRQSAVAA